MKLASDSMIGSPEGDAKRFFGELFRGAPPAHCITVCVAADENGGNRWRSAHIPVGDIDAAVRQAMEFDALGLDTYFGVAATCPGLSPLARGAQSRGELLGAGCVWADVDVGQLGHAGKKCPPDEASVAELLDEMPAPPSIAVDTGGGFHVYWLFDGWCRDLERVSAVCRAWQRLLRAKAEARGWSIDSTADAARVLRIPGTSNRKIADRPRAVALDPESTFRRYAIDELESMLLAAGQPITTTASNVAAMLVEMAALPIGDLWQSGPFDLAFMREKLNKVRRSKSLSAKPEELLKARRLGRVLDGLSLADEDGRRHEARRSVTAIIARALCTDRGAVPWAAVLELMRTPIESTPRFDGEQDPLIKTKALYESAAITAATDRAQQAALDQALRDRMSAESRMMKAGR